MTTSPLRPLADAQPARREEPGSKDFCTREGALALKAKIEAYWRERGRNVTLSLHNVGFHPAIRAARYDVRSDMVNGLPRAAAGGRPTPPPTSYDDASDEVFIDDDFGDLYAEAAGMPA